jgi:small subunit ribosomal protein S18
MENSRSERPRSDGSRSEGSRQYSRSSGPDGRPGAGDSRPHRFVRRKVCRFCVDKMDLIDFKDILRLKRFITERGKIVPRRISGNCARHQRLLTQAIKRARNIALAPFSNE